MKEVTVSKELFDRTFKEKNDWKDKYWELHDEIVDIEREKNKEIERLKEMKLHTEKYASEMEDKYILEKNKNNKAIEYIKEKARNNCWIDQYEANELIGILKGVDKE